MNTRAWVLLLPLALAGTAAAAAQGLLTPSTDTLWPALGARISLQTAEVSPLSLTSLADGSANTRGLKTAAVLGDYFFAQPGWGSFRATSGLMMGTQSSAAGANDARAATPYLGLGFNSQPGKGAFSLSADLGLVAETSAPLSASGRPLLGIQGNDGIRRDLRLSPLLQLAMRYSF